MALQIAHAEKLRGLAEVRGAKTTRYEPTNCRPLRRNRRSTQRRVQRQLPTQPQQALLQVQEAMPALRRPRRYHPRPFRHGVSELTGLAHCRTTLLHLRAVSG